MIMRNLLSPALLEYRGPVGPVLVVELKGKKYCYLKNSF
ncbi:hypothetical protein SAMN05444673_6279 [Bacillus sp. OV166]|nr:hypothetical protein SAMN05444673_6279 [Bacillus sp. OV166]